MFESNFDLKHVVDDRAVQQTKHFWTGFEGMKRDLAKPFPFSRPMGDVVPMIPESEWRDRTEELEKKGLLISQIAKREGVKPSNQGSTNFCWAHGITNAMRIRRAIDGQPYAELEAASVAARVKGGRNQGGWGDEAAHWIHEHGICERQYWPQNSRDMSNVTPEMKENAKKYRVIEFYELPGSSFEALASCLLQGVAVGIGLDWWSHLVCACDLLVKGGDWYIRIMNSWGENWEENGYGILTQRKATASGQVAMGTTTGVAA